MTVLVLIVCLALPNVGCKEETPAGLEYVTPIGCAVHGELDAQDWLGEHPKYVLKAWRCGPRREGA